MKLIIDIDEEMYKRICEAPSVPDMYGTDIVNALNRIIGGMPYNAPTVSDRYDEGYAQGYIDGSTGADWKDSAEN